ncbi:MAG: mandelate racemase/muconate lactonizing enzyme family protein [Candidatus Latescibacteria bacterium]|jgi:L-talarate/galactarate dehydratase|nr:mandelate racemase/muconate lactonizing enzyme family protein [Candidatus Latescibacterota bacterium]
MKISGAHARLLSVPIDNTLSPLVPRENATREFVTVELATDEGLTGLGLTGFGGPLSPGLRQAVEALAALIIGESPLEVEAIADLLKRKAGFSGPGGIYTLALSAIDTALWDIKGKAFGQSVCSLIGGYRDRVPTYASGALMRTTPVDLLAGISTDLVDAGFTQMKTQLGGSSTVSSELNRISVIRKTVGDDIDLMCDINQLWQTHQAISIGHRLKPFGLTWLEDVVAHDDYQGMAYVRSAIDTPIAAGEYVYGIRPFQHMMNAGCTDVVMIDLLRVGGITQWLKVAHMAEAFNLPVVSHLIPEIHVHLVAGIPNGLTTEYMPWTLPLFEETPEIRDGELLVPQRHGLGLNFNQDIVKQYTIA